MFGQRGRLKQPILEACAKGTVGRKDLKTFPAVPAALFHCKVTFIVFVLLGDKIKRKKKKKC